MDVKMGDYVPGSTVSTVCRCCLAEGCYKDISTEYFWMGKREVYSEMLSETLNLSIAYSKSGAPNSNSRLICEACISKLRDATDFKKQVQQCEKMFMQHLDPGSQVEIEVTPASSKDVKVECVKIENEVSDDDDVFEQDAPDAFDRPTLDDDDDYDDADDQPLTSLAKTKTTMKKERADVLDIMSNKQITVKRKIPETETRASKKTKKDITKPSASKQQTVKAKKSKDIQIRRRNTMVENIRIILHNTTAYPVKLCNVDLVCMYTRCYFKTNDPDELRSHIDKLHRSVNSVIQTPRYKRLTRVDITNLRCRRCFYKCNDLRSVCRHLVDVHKVPIDMTNNLNLVPLKLQKDRFDCVICDQKFTGVTQLFRHSGKHFCQEICEVCGKEFENKTTVEQHKLSHAFGKHFCRRCKTEFPSLKAKKEHVRINKSCMPVSCQICKERFPFYELKLDHLVKVHGQMQKIYKCTECTDVFTKRTHLYLHYKSKHTDDLKCPYCDRKFSVKSQLQYHVYTHTGERPYSCGICTKTFTTPKNLKQHENVHKKNEGHRKKKTLGSHN